MKWKTIQGRLSQKNPDPRLAAELTKLETILSHRSELLQLTRDSSFTNASGYSDYLIALARQHPAGIWLTSIDIKKNGASLTLEGRTHRAAILPEYLHRLSKEAVLAGKQLQTLRMMRDDIKGGDNSPISFSAATIAGIE